MISIPFHYNSCSSRSVLQCGCEEQGSCLSVPLASTMDGCSPILLHESPLHLDHTTHQHPFDCLHTTRLHTQPSECQSSTECRSTHSHCLLGIPHTSFCSHCRTTHPSHRACCLAHHPPISLLSLSYPTPDHVQFPSHLLHSLVTADATEYHQSPLFPCSSP